MSLCFSCTIFLKLLILATVCLRLYTQDVPAFLRPIFPPIFEVEVQGIFKDQFTEVDGKLYYDRENNIASLVTTYYNEEKTQIFNFNTSELIIIEGTKCSVEEIPPANFSFFYYTEENATKKIGSPEEVLYFSKSIRVHEDYNAQCIYSIPVYTYKTKVDVRGRMNCDVQHIFSDTEVEVSTCEEHSCQPTLLRISVKCPGETEEDEIEHVYNFFRFRSLISDKTVFQAPPGVFCPMKSAKAFPQLPNYFSFSYDLIKRYEGVTQIGSIHIMHKKIWYDADFKLVRVDEYDDDGLLMSYKIFDYVNGVAYYTVTSSLQCDMEVFPDDMPLEQITKLPNLFFHQNELTMENYVYRGKRLLHGIDYDVWSLLARYEKDDLTIVKDVYFNENVPNDLLVENSDLRIAYAEFYTYERNHDDSSLFELSSVTYVPINNFRSKPRNWLEFDVAMCYTDEQKKYFKLKIKGPTIRIGSYSYPKVLQLLYEKLVETTNISIVRISRLTGIKNNGEVYEFSGWILENMFFGNGKNNSEPDMKMAYKLLKEAIFNKEISFNVTFYMKENYYEVVSIESDIIQRDSTNRRCFSGAYLATASLVLLCLGMFIGAIGYYVFLKKRRQKEPKIDRVPLELFE